LAEQEENLKIERTLCVRVDPSFRGRVNSEERKKWDEFGVIQI